MIDTTSPKSGWQSRTGLLVALAGVIAALAGFYAAVFGDRSELEQAAMQPLPLLDTELPPTAAGRAPAPADGPRPSCRDPASERSASCGPDTGGRRHHEPQ